MSNVFDSLKALLNSKRPADALAGPGSIAGIIKARRDAALYADEDDPVAAQARDEARRRQHADHMGNSGQ